jgi:hypothetical protein
MLSWVTGVQPRRLPSLLPHRGGALVRGWRRPAPRHLAGHVVACTSRPQSPTPTQPAPQITTITALRPRPHASPTARVPDRTRPRPHDVPDRPSTDLLSSLLFRAPLGTHLPDLGRPQSAMIRPLAPTICLLISIRLCRIVPAGERARHALC